MVQIYFSRHFLRAVRLLSPPLQEKLAELLDSLKGNPFHVKLHTKPLSGKLSGLYSFRINRDWRVIFQFIAEDTIMLVDIGNRKDIYR